MCTVLQRYVLVCVCVCNVITIYIVTAESNWKEVSGVVNGMGIMSLRKRSIENTPERPVRKAVCADIKKKKKKIATSSGLPVISQFRRRTITATLESTTSFFFSATLSHPKTRSHAFTALSSRNHCFSRECLFIIFLDALAA